jgi:hypothetical protein
MKGVRLEEGDFESLNGAQSLSLPVDKGVFRRKQPIAPNYLIGEIGETRGDLESGVVEDPETGDQQPLLNGKSELARSSGSGVLGGLMEFFGVQSKSSQINGKRSRPQSHTSVLQRDESFVAHRNALVQQWKNTIRSKSQSAGAPLPDDDAPLDEVITLMYVGLLSD